MSIPPTKVWLGKEECFLLGVGKRSIKWAQEFGALRSEGEAREEVHRVGPTISKFPFMISRCAH